MCIRLCENPHKWPQAALWKVKHKKIFFTIFDLKKGLTRLRKGLLGCSWAQKLRLYEDYRLVKVLDHRYVSFPHFKHKEIFLRCENLKMDVARLRKGLLGCSWAQKLRLHEDYWLVKVLGHRYVPFLNFKHKEIFSKIENRKNRFLRYEMFWNHF